MIFGCLQNMKIIKLHAANFVSAGSGAVVFKESAGLFISVGV